jgi:DNA-binding NarL/FixJ family response regulator
MTELRSSNLTTREREVLKLIAEGNTDREIAVQLGISETTVETHVKHMSDKLGPRRRAALVALAKDLGLL